MYGQRRKGVGAAIKRKAGPRDILEPAVKSRLEGWGKMRTGQGFSREL